MGGDNKTYHEWELLYRIAEGDEAAFAQLFRHRYQLLAGYVFRITESREMTEEIVQDVFMKIWMVRETLLKIENFKAYLLVIARNQAYDEIIIKLVNPSSLPKQKTFSFDTKIITATQTVLGGHPDDMNSISQSQLIAPVTRPLKTSTKKLDVAIDLYSFNVIKIAMAGK